MNMKKSKKRYRGRFVVGKIEGISALITASEREK